MVTWEANDRQNPRAAEPTLVRLSSGFYERVAPKEPYPIELVCQRCGTAQPNDPALA